MFSTIRDSIGHNAAPSFAMPSSPTKDKVRKRTAKLAANQKSLDKWVGAFGRILDEVDKSGGELPSKVVEFDFDGKKVYHIPKLTRVCLYCIRNYIFMCETQDDEIRNPTKVMGFGRDMHNSLHTPDKCYGPELKAHLQEGTYRIGLVQ